MEKSNEIRRLKVGSMIHLKSQEHVKSNMVFSDLGTAGSEQRTDQSFEINNGTIDSSQCWEQ
jgi:hypothetical protein